MKVHQALIEDIRAYDPPAGRAAFWWIGQMGFVLKTQKAVLLLDPFLEPGMGREFPPPLEPNELDFVDYVLGSHYHGDHIDAYAWPLLAKASPNAKFIVPELLLGTVAEDLDMDATRFIGLDDGKSYHDLDLGVRISAIPSAHEFLNKDRETGLHPSLGYIIDVHGLRVYHAGDSCKYEGLEWRLQGLRPIDCMFLPINGRDGERLSKNCIGNMNFAEAVDLAGATSPGLVVPGHYEMFKSNSEDPRKFTHYMDVKYPKQKYWVGEYGERVEL